MRWTLISFLNDYTSTFRFVNHPSCESSAVQRESDKEIKKYCQIIIIINKLKISEIRTNINYYFEYITSLLTKIFISKLPHDPKLVLQARNPSTLLKAKQMLIETDHFFSNYNYKYKNRTNQSYNSDTSNSKNTTSNIADRTNTQPPQYVNRYQNYNTNNVSRPHSASTLNKTTTNTDRSTSNVTR